MASPAVFWVIAL